MKNRAFVISLIICFAVELGILFFAAGSSKDFSKDSVAVNRVLQSVEEDWTDLSHHQQAEGMDYTVIDTEGNVLFRTEHGESDTIHKAIVHGDTILDVEIDGVFLGKVIIKNTSEEVFQSYQQRLIWALSAVIFLQLLICLVYFAYLTKVVIKPFAKLSDFAKQVAKGNLDIPLEMDRKNIFGAFTEAFDLMRVELKKAREAEALANRSKKELVAELSHDIKTPVASIKAAAEVGAALAADEKTRENYLRIVEKADQITALTNNLLTATLEELVQLSVTPADVESGAVFGLLTSADYLHRTEVPKIPECLIYADLLRLQQVFDNIFVNSYKYADTEIKTSAEIVHKHLRIVIEDCGGGVPEEELQTLKQKFKRGSNAGEHSGAGLGLYIADYIMQEMGGSLKLANGAQGLKVIVEIALSASEDLRII